MNHLKNISQFNNAAIKDHQNSDVKKNGLVEKISHEKSDFASSLDEILFKKNSKENNATTNDQLGTNELKISKHAQKRIDEREISFSGDEYVKVQNAVAQLRQKGGNNSLIITDKAAYVVDVGSNKLVTAMNRQELKDNVFTKIDSTVVLPD
jgi:flagellar operon protein